MTPAEICSLSHLSALQSAEGDDDTEIDTDGDVAMLDQPGGKAQALRAAQHPGQAAWTRQHRAAAAVEACPSLKAPETPIGTQPGRSALGAKRSSSDAFNVSGEGLPGSKSTKAGGSSGETAPGAGACCADVPRANLPQQAHPVTQIAQIAQPQTPPQALEGTMLALAVEDEHGECPSLTLLHALPELKDTSPFCIGILKAHGSLIVA